jgi:hypothetical protein
MALTVWQQDWEKAMKTDPKANLQPGALARIFHESPAATTDMAVLPGVLGCRLLRRTVQVRLGTNTLHAAQAPALRAVAKWHAHLHGLATAIHETSGLGLAFLEGTLL